MTCQHSRMNFSDEFALHIDDRHQGSYQEVMESNHEEMNATRKTIHMI